MRRRRIDIHLFMDDLDAVDVRVAGGAGTKDGGPLEVAGSGRVPWWRQRPFRDQPTPTLPVFFQALRYHGCRANGSAPGRVSS